MNRSIIHQQISTLNEKINYLNDKLSKEQTLHPVELDLLKSYAHELQKLTVELTGKNIFFEKEEMRETVSEENKLKVVKEILEQKKEVQPSKQTTEKVEPKKNDIEISEDIEDLMPPVPQQFSKKKEEKNIIEEKPINVKQAEEIIPAAEKRIEEKTKKPSLNELFKKDSQALADKLQQAKKKNLKEIFDLNERYSFISNLFEGNSDNFNKTIQELAKCATAQEAEQIFKNAETKFSWNEKPVIASRFKEQVLQTLS